MKQTIIIIHGWDGNPEVGWFLWLEKELKKKGFRVIKPHMPNPAVPKIIPWVKKLAEISKNSDKNTILIGHSMGCQTIMRYLETPKAKKFSKIIFVAPWLTLTDAAIDETESYEIAKPWLKTPIDFKKVRSKLKSSTAIFSTNDPFVSIKNAEKFKETLGSKIIIQKNKGHFEEGKTEKIPVIIKEILED